MMRNSSSIAEQRQNFLPYPKKSKKSWTLKAFCLNNKNANRVPCNGAEREALIQAGLGEKKFLLLTSNVLVRSSERI